jgi:hypothetical protein
MPHFWNDPSNLAPKQAHRWVIHFGEDRVFFYAKSVDRPSYSLNTVKGKLLYSHTVNFPGRLTWNPIKVTLYDVNSVEKEGQGYDNNLSTQILIYDKTSALYSDPTQEDLLNIFKGVLARNLGTVKIIEMDRAGGKPTTTVLSKTKYDNNVEKDTWTLYNPIISDVSYGTMDYANAEVLAITLTIAYDWAELTPYTAKTTVTSQPELIEAMPNQISYTGAELPTIRKPSVSLGTNEGGEFTPGLEAENLTRQARTGESGLNLPSGKSFDLSNFGNFTPPTLLDKQLNNTPTPPGQIPETQRVQSALNNIISGTPKLNP